MNLPVIVILIFISIHDIRSHQIRHSSLVLLAMAYLSLGLQFNLANFLIVILILIPLYLFTDIGMGDIKLLLLLGVFASEYLFTMRYLFIAWIICLLTLAITVPFATKNRGYMPLAPAISLPLVALYLGF